ncbi:MAG: type VII toxin-antitoxin system MntA family adenylyltransferase antitoxin [Bacillota bacterium]
MTGDSRTVTLLKEYFADRENVVMAFLFGSMARGAERLDSDADVAVYLTDNYRPDDVNKLWGEIELLLKRDVDLLILNKDNPTVNWSAIRGIPLIIRDRSQYLEYMLRVSREAEDFQDFVIDLFKLKARRRGEPI